jgi:hypothetical protein
LEVIYSKVITAAVAVEVVVMAAVAAVAMVELGVTLGQFLIPLLLIRFCPLYIRKTWLQSLLLKTQHRFPLLKTRHHIVLILPLFPLLKTRHEIVLTQTNITLILGVSKEDSHRRL